MLRIPERALPAAAAAQLATYQGEVDALAAYEQRVLEAKRLFSSRNKKNDPTFRAVRDTLDTMCSGARRCMYCEDSVADEVEHFKPKAFYPEFVFSWDNYLYACGPCNGGKNNKFPLISLQSGEMIHLVRRRGEAIVPPEAGRAAIMHLRHEDPLAYLKLDLQGTFCFEEADPDRDSLDHKRARQVIEILGLNSRDYLPKARAEAFDSYCARLEQYVSKRNAGKAPPVLDLLQRSLQRMGHPTVWQEMKRQRRRIPRLRELFEEAPEALAW
jgi:uncharacterized protein (TIGR02646 family)